MRPLGRSGSHRTPWRSRRNELHQGNDGGFTLIELIIVSLVLPIVIGAITLALISVFSIQTSDSSRISGSGDAQVTASNFESDVQAASMIIAPLGGSGAPQNQNPATCGPGTEVISLLSGIPTGSVYPTEISYVVVQQGTSYTLVRNICQNGTQTGSITVSYNVPSPTSSSPLAAVVTCASTLTTAQALVAGSNTLSVSAVPQGVRVGDSIQMGTGSSAQTVSAAATNQTQYSLLVNAATASLTTYAIGTPVVDSSWATTNCGASTGWISATSLTGVTLSVTEPNVSGGSGPYTYTLSGTPRASTPANPLTTVSVPTATNCGFATAGTGTYATSLCFVDLSKYDPGVAYNATPSPTNGCQEMQASVPNTSFTLTFCVSVTGAPVSAHIFPTWTNAFLGNLSASGQPFYTGVPGSPAIYQTASGTTTVNFTGITVTTSNGTPATGWSIVTGDAETTDAGESITWTSNEPFSLLPNSSTSQVGNACSNPTSPDGVLPQSILTGGSPAPLTVECESSVSVSTPRTGTVMLQSPAPSTLTDTLVGTGLEGVFIGLLIPSGS